MWFKKKLFNFEEKVYKDVIHFQQQYILLFDYFLIGRLLDTDINTVSSTIYASHQRGLKSFCPSFGQEGD